MSREAVNRTGDPGKTGTFLVQIDVPSIKSYVFGTDPLNEVRGASAWLDRLNRYEMERVLDEHLETADLETIYANGGSAQFIVRRCDADIVESACRRMVRFVRDRTGGEVRPAYGIAPLPDGGYRGAVDLAHFQLRCRRGFGSGCHSATTLPAIMECRSASHLPAARFADHGAEGVTMLSEASHRKAREGRESRVRAVWSMWVAHLASAGPWPPQEKWQALRCADMTAIGERSSWRNYVGVVYADGNAMGKVVQALDSPETCRHFSKIVDESIRDACFAGLDAVMRTDVEGIRDTIDRDGRPPPLPADILLLGGDDLLVALPADRALDFAWHVTGEFEQLTRAKIEAVRDDGVRRFFRDHRGDKGFTISCGVAIVRSTYPFYLALDLATDLLQNAKRGPNAMNGKRDTARIDFHVVAGANSLDLQDIRRATYHTASDAPRTLRPLTRSQLQEVSAAVQELRRANFPRSKLHELLDAALTLREHQAERRIREIFARARHGAAPSQRRALWNAVQRLRPAGHEVRFPWFQSGNRRSLCVADIVDAYDLFRDTQGESGR